MWLIFTAPFKPSLGTLVLSYKKIKSCEGEINPDIQTDTFNVLKLIPLHHITSSFNCHNNCVVTILLITQSNLPCNSGEPRPLCQTL